MLVSVLVLAGCQKKNPEQLPDDIVWDRDVCDHCRMAISDPRYATQVVEPGGKAHLFDDAGCALSWIKNQPWKDNAKIWVADINTFQWLDAYKAHWRSGDSHTPMGYGFSASRDPFENALTFDEVRQRVWNHQALKDQHQGMGHNMPKPGLFHETHSSPQE
ncbi:MAG: protein NosL [SAR324 cluster bacterium]|nr:protein NosL [SAR324 cluster bacterium]